MSGYRFVALACAILSISTSATAQVDFASSNLPIILIDTGGEAIPDEPKIPGRMAIIDNGPGVRNDPSDAPTDYDGFIGIERRGASSQQFPKKQYGVETRNAEGGNRNVSLLGMPEENDWVLYAPYSDKSLIRNVLAFHMARATGRYASRTRLCELVLNGEYMGVYVLMEKVKRDRDRVDIATLRPEETSGDDLTGGYVLQVDRPDGSGWYSEHDPTFPMPIRPYVQYVDPGSDELAAEQRQYIRGVFEAFEDAMDSDEFADPADGYGPLIDVPSFVDYMLVTEASRNVDGYRLSAYLHKDKDSNDPRLHAGPVWDFNLAFGNADYLGAEGVQGYQYAINTTGFGVGIPFWWKKLAESEPFESAMRAHWTELRSGPFRTDSLVAFIRSTAHRLNEAQERNFERWPILGTRVWPNAYVGDSYADEVEYLEEWLTGRLVWMDGELAVTAESPEASGVRTGAAFPNPTRSGVQINVAVPAPEHVRVDVVDVRGRVVADLYDGVLSGQQRLRWNRGEAASGVYLLRVEGETFRTARRVSVLSE